MNKVLFSFIGIVLLITACKKGEEDPALSLLSRKSRLTGAWKFKNLTRTSTYSSGELFAEGDENQIVQTQTYSAGTTIEITTDINEYKMEFKKDGSWELIKDFEIIKVKDFGAGKTTTTYDIVLKENGKWSFLGKTKGEFKNKERLVLDVLNTENVVGETVEIEEYDSSTTPNDTTITAPNETITNYEIGSNSRIIELLRLANKEMIWSIDTETEYINESNPANNYIYEVEEKTTWQKID